MKNASDKPKVVLDTKPLVKLFAQEEGWNHVQKILQKTETEEIDAAISVVTLTEIYYKYIQEKRPDLAKTRTEELTYALYLKKLDINPHIAIKAGEFKGKYSISIADAFIAATAYFEEATVISDDPDYDKIPEIKTQTEKEFSAKLST